MRSKRISRIDSHVNHDDIIIMIVITELPSMVVLDKLGLKITFKLERPPNSPDQLVINMLAQNSGNTILTDFLFQVAVPKVRHIYNYTFTII